jgi:flagellar biosynthesis protein FliP
MPLQRRLSGPITAAAKRRLAANAKQGKAKPKGSWQRGRTPLTTRQIKQTKALDKVKAPSRESDRPTIAAVKRRLAANAKQGKAGAKGSWQRGRTPLTTRQIKQTKALDKLKAPSRARAKAAPRKRRSGF